MKNYKSIETNKEFLIYLQNKLNFVYFQVSKDFFYMVKYFNCCRIDILKNGKTFVSCDGGKRNASYREEKRDRKKANKFLKKMIAKGLVEEWK